MHVSRIESEYPLVLKDDVFVVDDGVDKSMLCFVHCVDDRKART